MRAYFVVTMLLTLAIKQSTIISVKDRLERLQMQKAKVLDKTNL